jgi:tRNA U34 5-methylaminomethyl-2-thiouridine-forming methyltransferase MnmC
MPMPEQPPELDWRDETIPVSRVFDDPYFSLGGGLAETEHVFLAGNGLNLLATLAAHTGPGHLLYTSFEAFPMPATDMARALSAFPELGEIARPMLDQWGKGARVLRFPNLTAQVVVGDARETLPLWQGRVDAWFLDGFSPAKNPELWSPQLMAEVARHTLAGGTFATYTAAGHVRRALAEAGFTVSRRPGYGRKRHMSVGVLGA